MTGFQKRQAVTDLSNQVTKRMRPDPTLDKGTLDMLSLGSHETHTVVGFNGCLSSENLPNLPIIPRNNSPNQTPKRRKKKAHRKGVLATPKITEWLQVTPSPEVAATEKKRRQRRSKKHPQESPTTSSPNPTGDHFVLSASTPVPTSSAQADTGSRILLQTQLLCQDAQAKIWLHLPFKKPRNAAGLHLVWLHLLQKSSCQHVGCPRMM